MTVAYVRVHTCQRMATDQHSRGRAEAARTIEEARRRQLPMLTRREAARQAGISGEGWRKVINTGRAREETLLAMARVVGVEQEVRVLLGLEPPKRELPIDYPPGLTENEKILWSALPALKPEERMDIIEYIRFRASRGRSA